MKAHLQGLSRTLLACAVGSLVSQYATSSTAAQSAEETAGRPAIRLAAQAVRGVYQFYQGGGPDGRMVRFQNLNTNGEALEARLFDSGTKVLLFHFAKVPLPHRTLTQYDPPLNKPRFLVAIFRRGALCQQAEVSAPAMVNITVTCRITVVPIVQKVPAALMPYGVTKFLGRYKAGQDKLTYVIAQTPSHLLIAFLGTENTFPENDAMNADAVPSVINPGFAGIPTHKGWAEAVDELLPLIRTFVDSWRGSRALYVTGFSMGGSVGGHLTYRLMDTGYTRTMRLVTFGAPRYALQKFTDEFYARAAKIPIQAYSVEFPHDPKRLLWQIAVEAVRPDLQMDLRRIGHVVDYSCGETSNPAACAADPHDYSKYAEVAERRYALSSAR